MYALLFLLAVILIILKSASIIAWAWWIIFIPIYTIALLIILKVVFTALLVWLEDC